MAVSTRVRFEVFKRDGFRCVYCGATPVEMPLHVDHVEPSSAGGDDSPSNLVTSCEKCNLGKSSVPLDKKRYATGRATEADEDHAHQILEYLAIQREVAKAKNAVSQAAIDYWRELIGGRDEIICAQMDAAISRNGLENVMEAIGITSRNAKLRSSTSCYKYFYGVLRRMRGES
jgi:hypothetical protein